MGLLVVVLGFLGAIFYQDVDVCFNPVDAGGGGSIVCPLNETSYTDGSANLDKLTSETATPWDVPAILIIGASAAALSAAVALRQVQGSSTPFSLPVALAMLKLPTGALTALLGLLLMRGQFIPGFSALDFPAQVLAWAVLLGYSQQLLTRSHRPACTDGPRRRGRATQVGDRATRRTAGYPAGSPGQGAVVGSEPWVGAVSSAGSSACSSVWVASVSSTVSSPPVSAASSLTGADVSGVGLLGGVGRWVCAVLGLCLLSRLVCVAGINRVAVASGLTVVERARSASMMSRICCSYASAGRGSRRAAPP